MRAWAMVATPVQRLVLFCALAGCTSDDPAPGRTSFVGVYAAATESGTVELTLAVPDTSLLSEPLYSASLITGPNSTGLVDASGAVRPLGGAPVDISGTYEPRLKVVYLTGSGHLLDGYVEDDETSTAIDETSTAIIEGRFFGPHAVGVHMLFQSTEEPITLLCGRYDGSDEGPWNLALAPSGAAVGVVASVAERDDLHQLIGSYSGQSLVLQEEDAEQIGIVAEGTVLSDAAAASGTWQRGGDEGTWKASEADCSTTR